MFPKAKLPKQRNHLQAKFAVWQRPAPFFLRPVGLMEARTTRLTTLTHDQSHSPETREHGNRPVAVLGHPEELTTLLTTLFQRGQGHFMRRFGACASSSHRSSPMVLMCLPFLLGYTCCQPEFAIQQKNRHACLHVGRVIYPYYHNGKKSRILHRIF